MPVASIGTSTTRRCIVDYTPAQYFLRNPNSVRTRGLYESLIEQMDATVYPVRSNRGVNRGYRDEFFRADGSSIVIQGAGTPTIYRGDKYPKAAQGNAFITDSPTNLVHQMVVDRRRHGPADARRTPIRAANSSRRRTSAAGR